MLSNIPFDMEKLRKLGKEQVDVELVRIGLIAELDAINLYEQLASLARDELVKRTLLDIAREEKEHFGEFLELLRNLDTEIEKAMEEGSEEVEEMRSKEE